MRCRAGRDYRIFVAWPSIAPPPEGFGVLYLLDANASFCTMVEAMRMQSRRPQSTGVEPFVVVGIGYPTDEPFDLERRAFDYTPQVAPERIGARPNGEAWPRIGGAAEFRAFLFDQVMPEIARSYPVDDRRQALFGHSLGGLFVLDTLLQTPGWFQAYLASSPSLWWGERVLFDRLGPMAAALPPAIVQISVGALEQAATSGDGTTGDDYARWSQRNRMIDNARDFASGLAAVPGLDVRFHLFENEHHGSVVASAISRAIGAAFSADNKDRPK